MPNEIPQRFRRLVPLRRRRRRPELPSYSAVLACAGDPLCALAAPARKRSSQNQNSSAVQSFSAYLPIRDTSNQAPAAAVARASCCPSPPVTAHPRRPVATHSCPLARHEWPQAMAPLRCAPGPRRASLSRRRNHARFRDCLRGCAGHSRDPDAIGTRGREGGAGRGRRRPERRGGTAGGAARRRERAESQRGGRRAGTGGEGRRRAGGAGAGGRRGGGSGARGGGEGGGRRRGARGAGDARAGGRATRAGRRGQRGARRAGSATGPARGSSGARGQGEDRVRGGVCSPFPPFFRGSDSAARASATATRASRAQSGPRYRNATQATARRACKWPRIGRPASTSAAPASGKGGQPAWPITAPDR